VFFENTNGKDETQGTTSSTFSVTLTVGFTFRIVVAVATLLVCHHFIIHWIADSVDMNQLKMTTFIFVLGIKR
jgi:hypothetical protein